MNRRRWAIIGAMIAIFMLIYAIGSVNAGVSFSYNLTGNGDIKANDNYNGKVISYEGKAESSIKEVQYSFIALGTNSDNSSLYHYFDTAKGLETNSVFNCNYAATGGNSTKVGVMDMTENIGLTSIYSGYTSKGASYEEVDAYSMLTGTNMLTATTTKVGLTDDPVGVQYKIYAGGEKEGALANGKVSAGVSMYVVNCSNGGLWSKWSYEEESTASGSFEFYKVIAYTSKITTP
jgi:hypothetical protein